MTDGLILLVEDDDNDVFFFQRAAKKADVLNPIQVAKDGKEAISYLLGKHPFTDPGKHPLPCLIFLDLNLPQKHGLQVLKWIRNTPEVESIIVVILTSSSSEEDIQEAYRLGGNSYLVKPTNPDELVKLLKLLKLYWLTTNHNPPPRRMKNSMGYPPNSMQAANEPATSQGEMSFGSVLSS